MNAFTRTRTEYSQRRSLIVLATVGIVSMVSLFDLRTAAAQRTADLPKATSLGGVLSASEDEAIVQTQKANHQNSKS